MDATVLLREFCDAVERQDGRRFADLFCEDGIYHDVFYGEFAGQAKIAEMINDWFFKSATDMRWDMHDPVCDGKILYVRYTFSYTSLLPEADGKRAMFEEVAIMRLRDGRIADYREVANTGPGFVDMNSPQSASSKFCGAREMRLRPALKPPGIWLKPHPSQIEPAVSWNGRTPGRYWGDSLPPTGVRKVVQMTRSGNSVHRPMADGHRGREQRASFHAVGRIALDL